MGAATVTMVRMETTGRRGLPRTTQTRGQCAQGLARKRVRAWPMAAESNASVESRTACNAVSSNEEARVGKSQGSMKATSFQENAGYLTRMSGGAGGRGRKASSCLDGAA